MTTEELKDLRTRVLEAINRELQPTRMTDEELLKAITSLVAAMERFAVPHRDYYAWCGPNAGGFVLDAKDWTEKHLLYLVKTVQYTKESRA